MLKLESIKLSKHLTSVSLGKNNVYFVGNSSPEIPIFERRVS
jgi:hypothetical protein